MTGDEFVRYRRAAATLDLWIDVLGAWAGRYEDDDMPADIDWILAVIPQQTPDPPPAIQRGWLCVDRTATPGIGWECSDVGFRLASLCGSFHGLRWPVTRGQFRAAAKASGVSLPSRHATLHLLQADAKGGGA